MHNALRGIFLDIRVLFCCKIKNKNLIAVHLAATCRLGIDQFVTGQMGTLMAMQFAYVFDQRAPTAHFQAIKDSVASVSQGHEAESLHGKAKVTDSRSPNRA